MEAKVEAKKYLKLKFINVKIEEVCKNGKFCKLVSIS